MAVIKLENTKESENVLNVKLNRLIIIHKNIKLIGTRKLSFKISYMNGITDYRDKSVYQFITTVPISIQVWLNCF